MDTINCAPHVFGDSQELVTVNTTNVDPPQAEGAPELLFEITPLQPPVKDAVASHVANFASMAACVWHAASTAVEGHVSTTAGAAVTVNEAEQVIGPSHELVTVNVTVVEPPQAKGAPLLLLEITAKQPPVNVAEFNQVVNLASITACVWQAASVTLDAQLRFTNGAAATLNVAEHVLLASQVLVTVNVTVFVPPQAEGAPLLLLDIVALQPPLNETVVNQVANLESIAACV